MKTFPRAFSLISGRAPRSGFTLLELLAVIAIVAILSALSYSGIQKLRKAGQAAACTSNLRQIGAAMAMYAGEHNGVVDLYAYKGAGTSIGWLKFLRGRATAGYDRGTGGSTYLDSSASAACPGFAPFRNLNDSDYCYGTALQTTDPFSRPPAVPNISMDSRQISLAAVNQPGKYWVLIDSFNPSRDNQQFYVIDMKTNKYGAHFRHSGAANVLFLDGHVEAMKPKQIEDLPYNPLKAGFNEKQEAFTF